MPLTSITIPCLGGNIGEFEELLTCWSDPRLFPLHPNETPTPLPLCVVLNRGDTKTAKAFKAAFHKAEKLHSVFSDCLVFDAGLEGDRDLYARETTEAKGQFGNKAGPNFLFFEGLRAVRQFEGHTLLNEVDCFPLHRGWLSDLQQLVEARRFAWVIGSYYTGEHPVGRDIQYHFNGNALYKSGCPQFQDFLTKFWEPRLLDLIEQDPNLAYDCWWAVEKTLASSEQRNSAWQLVSQYDQFFCNRQFLINTLLSRHVRQDSDYCLENAKKTGEACHLLHGQACAPLVQAFLASQETSLPDYLQQQAAQERQDYQALSPQRPALEEDPSLEIIPQWTSSASNGARPEDLFGKSTPIIIEDLPRSVPVTDITRECFLGNWHKEAFSDHIWAGGGLSALQLQFSAPLTHVRITVRGQRPKGAKGQVFFKAVGASDVSVSHQKDGNMLISAKNEDPFENLILMVEESNPVFVEGDNRDLAYALFGLEISDVTIPNSSAT